VPDARKILLALEIKLPFLKKKQLLIKIPTFRKHVMKEKGGHCWEIGTSDYPLRKIRNEIKKAGFNISGEKVFMDTPRNYYFLLIK
jgi:hypothetical protein